VCRVLDCSQPCIHESFRFGIIKPIPKNKLGDLISIEMYCRITLTPVIPKLFESMFLFNYIMKNGCIVTHYNLASVKIAGAPVHNLSLQNLSDILIKNLGVFSLFYC